MKEKTFFAKYSLWDRNAIPFYRELIKNQTLSMDELEDLNWRKRKKLITHAFDHVPFYRQHFKKAGFDPQELVVPEDYSKVPLLTRDYLREYFEKMKAEGVDRRFLKESTTGGTTGKPVRVYLDRRVSHAPLGWRMMSWWGLSPAVDMAISWRKTLGVFREGLEKVIWWPTRQIKLNSAFMTFANIERFFKRYNRLKPPLLHGYVGAIHHLAHYIEQTGLSVVPPQAVWVTCAPLSKVHRNFIEKVFQAPVYDQYGSCEVYWISSQCKEKGDHHIFYDCRYVEFCDQSGKPVPAEQEGEVLVTDLENYAFPIIRYKIGDRGRSLRGRCACGITLPLMDAVAGKSVELIKLPDGTCISDMNVIFDDFPEVVKGFQVYQQADFTIEVRYVPGSDSGATKQALSQVKKRIKMQTRNQVKIVLKKVGQIPHKQGKLCYVFSEISQDKIHPAQ